MDQTRRRLRVQVQRAAETIGVVFVGPSDGAVGRVTKRCRLLGPRALEERQGKKGMSSWEIERQQVKNKLVIRKRDGPERESTCFKQQIPRQERDRMCISKASTD